MHLLRLCRAVIKASHTGTHGAALCNAQRPQVGGPKSGTLFPLQADLFFFFSSLSSPKRLDSDRIQGDGQPELGTECVPVQRHDQAQEKTGFIRNESQAWTRFARRCRSPPFQARTDKRQGGYDSRQDRSRSSKLRSGGRRMV